MQEDKAPFFSVIVPIFNKENTVRKCIDSVISQTFTDWELILVNDGSTDRSKDVINSYCDERIKYLEHENHGVSYTRNVGLKVAKGEYIQFLDADDYIATDRLANLYKGISSHKADVYFTGITMVDVRGNENSVFMPFDGFVPVETFKETFFRIENETSLYGFVPTKIISRDYYLRHNLFFDESIRMAEDFEMFLRCYQKAQTFCCIADTGYFYVHYTGGTSMYSRNVDYFSLISIQKKMNDWIGSYMSVKEKDKFDKKIASLAECAVYTVSPTKIFTIPRICRCIEQDEWIYKRAVRYSERSKVLFHIVKKDYVWLMIYVCLKQTYIRMYQKIKQR